MYDLTEIIDMMGALGTFALALAAYWNIFKPLKPKIKISAGINGEYMSNFTIPTPIWGVSCVYFIYRLKVENCKKFSSYYAKKVYLRFMEISKMNRDNKWDKLQPFNPFMMRWTSTTGINDVFQNDLGKGEYLYVNFFAIKRTLKSLSNQIDKSEIIPGHEPIKGLALAAGFPLEELGRNGTFKFKIGIFGENVKPNEYTFKVEVRDMNNIQAPTISIEQM
jgi:hypothetical protein